MVDIQVSKIDEVFLKVACEDGVAADIASYFTFFSPGYEYSTAYREHRWDGKTKLFNPNKKKLYIGMFRYLIEFAKTRNYTIDFDTGIQLLNNYSLEEGKDYIKSLHIHSGGNPIEAYDYQVVAFTKAIRYKRTLLLSPTSSGKSLIIYAIWRYLLTASPLQAAKGRGATLAAPQREARCNGLIIVPTINLVEQLFKDFVDYATPDGEISIKDTCQKIYGGQDRTITLPIVISTWQSIHEKMMTDGYQFLENFDFVIGDEAHMFQSKSLTAIMTHLVNAQYRIGTTGTIHDTKIHKLVIEGHFGPATKIVTTKKLMDDGKVSDLNIKAIVLQHPEHSRKLIKKQKTYMEEMDFLCACAARNNFLKNLAISLNGNTLLLFQYIEKHGNVLYDLIKSKVHEDRKVFFVFGGTELEQRESVREITEKEKNAIIIASYGVYSTGVNIRNLHNIIFGSPSKSKIRVLQSIGRGLRLGDDKTSATLYDIADDFSIEDRWGVDDMNTKVLLAKKFINRTMKHYYERIKIYKEEEFKVSGYNVELKYD